MFKIFKHILIGFSHLFRTFSLHTYVYRMLCYTLRDPHRMWGLEPCHLEVYNRYVFTCGAQRDFILVLRLKRKCPCVSAWEEGFLESRTPS